MTIFVLTDVCAYYEANVDNEYLFSLLTVAIVGFVV